MENKEITMRPERRTYTVEEVAAILDIGRTTAYKFIREEQPFKVIRIGNAIRIPKKAFEDWFKTVSEW